MKTEMKTKNKSKIFLSFLTIAIVFVGCTKESTKPETIIKATRNIKQETQNNNKKSKKQESLIKKT